MQETEIGEVTMTIEWVKTLDEVDVVGGVAEDAKGMTDVVRGLVCYLSAWKQDSTLVVMVTSSGQTPCYIVP